MTDTEQTLRREYEAWCADNNLPRMPADELSAELHYARASSDDATEVDRIARQLFPDAVSGVFYQLKSCRNMLQAAASWGEPVSTSSFLMGAVPTPTQKPEPTTCAFR